MKSTLLPRTAMLLLSASLLGGCFVPQPDFPVRVRDDHRILADQKLIKPHDMGQFILPRVVDLTAVPGLDQVIPKLAEKQVVYIGESHSRYEHHLNQLEIIKRLHRIHPDLVIGMEFFQQPFQPVLDDYIAGELTEYEFLEKSEYFERWGYDYRLYRPILEYAREQRIPVIALNVSKELVEKVRRDGLGILSDARSLTEEEFRQAPAEVDRSDLKYQERLQRIYRMHPNKDQQTFARFQDVQLLWDEGMAKKMADFLRENEDRHMVVLAGSGHLIYGSGIPNRVKRRLKVDSAIVLQDSNQPLDLEAGDFLLLPEPLELPPAGRMGIYMGESGDHGVIVEKLAQGSAAKEAGIEKGDELLTIDGQPVKTAADVKLAMLDREPGDTVVVTVWRPKWVITHEDLEFRFELR